MDKSLVMAFYREFLENLPCYAEEMTELVPLSLADLKESLKRRMPELTDEALEGLICATVHMLCVLGLLDEAVLRHSNIRFISFAARTMAFSVLDVLATGLPYLGKGFWHAGTSEQGEKQHAVLRWAEEQRLANNDAAPIARFSHVSWCMLRIWGRFLCIEREGGNRGQCERQHGKLSLLGGRVQRQDLPPVIGLTDKEKDTLLAGDDLGAYRDQAHERAAQREIMEEIGLLPSDYTLHPLGDIPPYEGVFGSGAACAYTRTRFRLYRVDLTLRGCLRLARYPGLEDDRLWFTAPELLKGVNKAGEKAFVDALRSAAESIKASGGDVYKELESVSESFPRLVPPREPEIVLPIRAGEATVYRSALRQDCYQLSLDDQQAELLVLLAMAGRSFKTPGNTVTDYFAFEPREPGLFDVLLGGVCVPDGSDLHQRLQGLSASMPEGLVQAEDDFFRLQATAYLSPSLFTWELKDPEDLRASHKLVFQTEPIVSTLLNWVPCAFECPVEETLARALQRGEATNTSYYENWRKSKGKEIVRSFGLRDFASKAGGVFTILCKPMDGLN